MISIAEWCTKNELILNTNPEKTETMLFGTAKNLSQQPQSLNVMYRNQLINPTKTYKYLGVDIDYSLNMNSNFDYNYKKACGRLKLLRKIRPFLNITAAMAIYQGMVLPILRYCGLLHLKLSKTREDRLLAFHKRALEIITLKSNNGLDIKPPFIINQIRTCQLVRQCIDGNICSNFKNYFEMQTYDKATRNRGYQLKVPKIRLEYSRGSFYFIGAKLYNSLPLNIRKTECYSSFDRLLTEYFQQVLTFIDLHVYIVRTFYILYSM